MSEISPSLRALARAYGVAPSYINFDDKRINANAETLLYFVSHLSNSELKQGDDFREIFSRVAKARQEKGLPPVLVAWDGKLSPLWFWTKMPSTSYTVTATPEEGKPAWSKLFEAEQNVMRSKHQFKRVKLGAMPRLSSGYYELSVQDGEREVARTFVISAPEKLKASLKNWGVFTPVYALRCKGSKPIGDFSDLAELCQLVEKEGGAFVGTLPVLAADYETKPDALSPYAPSSRLFWNEIYLDVADLPARQATSMTNTPGNINSTLREGEELVDYPATYAWKQDAIAVAATEFFAAGGAEDSEYRAYRVRAPYLDAYATFRGKGNATVENYHRYAQYACDRQLQAIKAGCSATLYLDYPVGVASDGFDAKQFGNLFLQGFQVGAPPDLFYGAGQTWGFQALHPQAVIAERFKYFRSALEVYFAQARMVRLDHVMGFYRLYCVPDGQKATAGAYIYYPFEAMLAILCLEAHRHDAELIGEDLGTVPEAVRAAMDRHGLGRMWLLPFEAKPDRGATFANVPEPTIASFNTHDMFPYAAYRSESDLTELEKLKLIGKGSAANIRAARSAQWKAWNVGPDGYEELLGELAKSPARHVMINLEDSWREREPQNIPGTTDQYPNWRHRHRHALEEFATLPGMRAAFDILQLKRGSTHG